METKSIISQEQQDEEMQLIPLLKLCYHQFINHWAWFALSAVVCGCIGWYYQQCQPRVYQRRAEPWHAEASGHVWHQVMLRCG